MQALILKDTSTTLALESAPIPTATPGTVVVKVLATNLSPNARRIWSGAMGFPLPPFPYTPSGPSIARVYAVGEDSTTLTEGQLVFVNIFIKARDSPAVSLLQGSIGTPTPAGKKLGSAWQHGTLAEYARLPLENIFPLNESLLIDTLGYTFADLVSLGDVSIVAGGLFGPLGVKPGDNLIIAPATGRFGGTAIQVALALGCRIIAAGRNETTLGTLSQTFGTTGRLTTVKLTGDVNVDTQALKEAAGGDGADAYFDWSPPVAVKPNHIQACIQALRPQGRCALMGGVLGTVEIPYFFVLLNNIRIEGRYMFEKEDVWQIIKLVEGGLLKLGEKQPGGFRVQKGFKLKDIEKALDAVEKEKGWGSLVVVEP